MRITFVFSGFPRVPVGGFAVAYEYANRLAARGHAVTLLHPRVWLAPRGWRARLRSTVAASARRVTSPLPGTGRPEWYALDDRVASRLIGQIPSSVPDADAIVATSWETAGPVADLPAAKGRKYQLVQHYETWAGSESLVDASWRLPLHKIVIARWLEQKARELGVRDRVDYIPNGLDHDRFRLTAPISGRDPVAVGFLYHEWPWKGVADAVAALATVRAQVPELRPVAFGTARKARLPDWITYRPGLRGTQVVALYNSLSIFLHASWTEGWPLPPAEAMACGCALVAAANPGVCDYADAEGTALMAPVHDVEGLAAGILRLIRDAALRERIAIAGADRMRSYTWETAVEKFEAVLAN